MSKFNIINMSSSCQFKINILICKKIPDFDLCKIWFLWLA